MAKAAADAETIAESVKGVFDPENIRSMFSKAEKASGLAPVFLKRESFAQSAVSTGSICVDKILGGGIPPGRIIGISGPEKAGKSLLTTQIMVNQLEDGRLGVLHDAEGATDPLFLKARGINFDKFRGKRTKGGNLSKDECDKFYFYQPTTGEEVLNYIHNLTGSLPENRNPIAPPVIYALDSVVALITDSLEEDLDSNKVAMHAKMYAQMLPIINGSLVKSGCSFIYTNQVRRKVMASKYERADYEPCGEALKFFSSIRMNLFPMKPKLFDEEHPFLDPKFTGAVPKAGGIWEEPHYVYTDGKIQVSGTDRYIYTSIKTEKNKVYNPYKLTWIRIQFEQDESTGQGLDPVFDSFTFLAEMDFIRPATARDGEKKSDVAHLYECVPSENFNPAELGMQDRFSYPQYKIWVSQNPGFVKVLRDKYLLSGLAFE
jgi:RecA/RadA recombinase